MIETQRGIAAWSLATFGDKATDFRIAARANEEMAELLRALSAERPAAEVIEEAADVAIVLCKLAHRHEISIYPTTSAQFICGKAITTPWLSAWCLGKLATVMMDQDRNAMKAVIHGLAEICARLGGNLGTAVDAKMAINRTRQWKTDGWSGDGAAYHVRPPQPEAGDRVSVT